MKTNRVVDSTLLRYAGCEKHSEGHPAQLISSVGNIHEYQWLFSVELGLSRMAQFSQIDTAYLLEGPTGTEPKNQAVRHCCGGIPRSRYLTTTCRENLIIKDWHSATT